MEVGHGPNWGCSAKEKKLNFLRHQRHLLMVDIFDTWHLWGKMTLMLQPVTNIFIIIKLHLSFTYSKSQDNPIGIVTRLWA
jgi:hypothetical protein